MTDAVTFWGFKFCLDIKGLDGALKCKKHKHKNQYKHIRIIGYVAKKKKLQMGIK